jgi:hypothetical protein
LTTAATVFWVAVSSSVLSTTSPLSSPYPPNSYSTSSVETLLVVGTAPALDNGVAFGVSVGVVAFFAFQSVRRPLVVGLSFFLGGPDGVLQIQ